MNKTHEKQFIGFSRLYEEFLTKHHNNNSILCFNKTEYSTRDLSALVDRYVCHLKHLGIQPGMAVGYTMPNCVEVIALFFAICRVGGYAVPLFHMVPDSVKASVLQKGRASLVVTTSALFGPLQKSTDNMGLDCKYAVVDQNSDCYSFEMDAPADQDSVPVEMFPQMPALLTSSSGTTGIPKAVMWNQENLSSVLRASMDLASSGAEPGDGGYSAVIAFPLSTAGLLVISGILFAGVRIVFSSDMSPVTFLELAQYWSVQSMAAPPAYFEAILRLPHLESFKRDSIRNIMTGMDFFSPALMSRMQEKFPNIDSFGNGYGLTETSNVFMVGKQKGLQELSQPTNILSVSPGIGNEISIRDEDGKEVPQGEKGELWVKGPSVVNGYLGNEEETQQAFSKAWFKTGDIAQTTAPDTIILLGRNKYLIKRGGKSISPIVVQDVINKVDGVKNSAVVGVPHELYGQMIWAFVESSEDLEKDIRKQCRSELANYMMPDQIRFVENIPKNPGVGKVNAEELIRIAKEDLKNIVGVK